ncbi:MAG: hypothetical protein H6683_08140 [Deltaproteobacteria bacterium]|nr:hypothetical protein [Deltaproteobacteria bacterium]
MTNAPHRISRSLAALAAALIALATGCSEGYFNALPVYTAREMVTREDKVFELGFAMNEAKVNAVALVASPDESPPEKDRPAPLALGDTNKIVLELAPRIKARVFPIVHLRDDVPDMAAALQDDRRAGAKGLAIRDTGREGELPWSDPRVRGAMDYAGISGMPVFATVNGGEEHWRKLSAFLHDHPEMTVIGAGYLGRPDDLAAVQAMMELHPNLQVDTGLDAEPGAEKTLAALAENRDATRRFFNLMQRKILFATGTLYDHRLYRRGFWGMQVFKTYRQFLERPRVESGLIGEDRGWYTFEIPGLDLSDELLKRLYMQNFYAIFDGLPDEPATPNLDTLLVDAPEGWRGDEASERQLIAILTTPYDRGVLRLSTAQLRAIFLGKLTNWSDLRGRSGRISLASYGNLAELAARVLKVPLRAEVVRFDDAAAMTQAIREAGDMIGVMPMGAADGRLATLTVDADNPFVSNVALCASKSQPVVRNYFQTYPLLVPIAFDGDASDAAFDPFELRTVLAGGTVTPPSSMPERRPNDPDELAAWEIREASRRQRPIVTVSLEVRRADVAIFEGAAPDEDTAFLYRNMGVRALVDGGKVTPLSWKTDEATDSWSAKVRGRDVCVVDDPAKAAPGCLTVVSLPDNASPAAVRSAVAADPLAVMQSGRIVHARGLGGVDIPLGQFLGEDGAKGLFVAFTLYKDRLTNVYVLPVNTDGGAAALSTDDESMQRAVAAYRSAESPVSGTESTE